MLEVVNTRNDQAGVAVKNGDSYTVVFGDGSQKEVSENSFKRWYKVVGGEEEAANETQQSTETGDVQEAAPTEGPAVSENQGPTENPHQVVTGESSITVNISDDDVPPPAEPVEAPTPAEAVAAIAEAAKAKTEGQIEDALKQGFKVIDGRVEKTRKDGTKVYTKIQLPQGSYIEILEYGGYITGVQVADAKGEVQYKSPKFSVQDALSWIGLQGTELKDAKKNITVLRKQVKETAAHS